MNRILLFVVASIVFGVLPVRAQVSDPALTQLPALAVSDVERQLPSTVLSAFQKAYPAATINGADQGREDGRIVFTLTATDRGRHLVLVYTLEGSVVESSEEVLEAELPAPVLAAMRKHAKHPTLARGMKVTRGLQVHYDLTLRGTRRPRLVLKPDGTLVDAK